MLREMRYGTGTIKVCNKRKKLDVITGKSVGSDSDYVCTDSSESDNEIGPTNCEENILPHKIYKKRTVERNAKNGDKENTNIKGKICTNKKTKKQLAIQEKVAIKPCVLFMDHDFPFIGATPEGLIGQDTVVEVKCPLVPFKKCLEECIKENKVQIWKYNKKSELIEVNKNSNWYHKIQEQLHKSNTNEAGPSGNCNMVCFSKEPSTNNSTTNDIDQVPNNDQSDATISEKTIEGKNKTKLDEEKSFSDLDYF
ncbi:unnamed protein product [Euphydryas editha]|uniref:YqaJ viral recombinase domain-containing protein n=1 Tax=Euphydryas editha TaxID=104508 RepID=A0AAU9TS84_EUPED|nr:unnamed protein product [Euphydryas editha]